MLPRLDDHAYFVERARQERTRASCSTDNGAALAHARMADEYECLVRATQRADALLHWRLGGR